MRGLLLAIVVVVGAAAQSRAADPATPKEFTAARKLYLVKCAKCHELHEPGKYSAAEWREWFVKMNRKSKLNVNQADALQQYTDWLRSQPKPERK